MRTHIFHSVADAHVTWDNGIHCVADPQVIEIWLQISLKAMVVWQLTKNKSCKCTPIFHIKGGSRTAATSTMEHFVININGWKLLTIITKSSILDVAALLDPPLHIDQPHSCSITISLYPVNQSTCKQTILLEYKIERNSTTIKTVFYLPL